MTFEEDKQRTLNRIKTLRVMNYLGMVAWHEDILGGAKQKIRILHPLGLVWFTLMILFYTVWYGVEIVFEELPQVMSNETVWW